MSARLAPSSNDDQTRPLLWGPGELRRELGITAQTLSRWKATPGFPQAVELQIGAVWFAEDVLAWRQGVLAEREQRRADRAAG